VVAREPLRQLDDRLAVVLNCISMDAISTRHISGSLL
jgi:hypothetical protein